MNFVSALICEAEILRINLTLSDQLRRNQSPSAINPTD
jgi:hypothetical protein